MGKKNNEELVEEAVSHQIAMLLIGALAGFAATKFANYAYKSALEVYRTRKTQQEIS